ncbi:helix-turn-helix domain-containing protein [Peptoanaerobacter stomatis]
MDTVGERIRDLRIKRKLTLNDLADMVGVSKTTIVKYENGTTKSLKYETAEKISNIFNVSVDYLLNGIQEEKDDSQKLVEMLYQKTLDKKIQWLEVDDNSISGVDAYIYTAISKYLPAFEEEEAVYYLKDDKIFIFLYNENEKILLYGDYNINLLNTKDFYMICIDKNLDDLYKIIFEPENIFKKEKTNEFINFLKEL